MVNIVVMPILSVPQVMDWNPHGHDAAVYGIGLKGFKNDLGYANCAALYGISENALVNGTGSEPPDCHHVQLVNACTLANSLLAATFLSQMIKVSGLVDRCIEVLFKYVLWPLWFKSIVRRWWECCVYKCGAHSSKLKYKHVYFTYEPLPFDLGYHWVRVLYILALCFFIAPGMPVAYTTTTIALLTQYCADKWYFFNRSLPSVYTGYIGQRTMPRLVLLVMRIFLFFHIIYSMMWWQFTTTNFLDIQVLETTSSIDLLSNYDLTCWTTRHAIAAHLTD